MIKKTILLLAIAFSTNGFAQKNNISPYSFFGLGDTTESKSVSELSMGGIGGAQNSAYKIYYTNPASYSALKLTIMDFAASSKYLSVNDNNNKQNASSFSISYLALGFPITKKSGLVFGIQPKSKVGYSILDEQDVESDYFFGSGGTNRVFVGFGYKLPYNLSVGIEGSYDFGSIERNILNRIDEIYLATMYRTASQVGGYSLKIGTQAETKINEKINIQAGFTLHLENEYNNRGNVQMFTLTNSTDPSIIVPRDYLINEEFESTIVNPLKTIASIGIGEKNKWYAGFEYSKQNAIIFRNDLLQSSNIKYGTSSRFSFGGFYTPKSTSITSFWERVTYKTGFYNKNTGLIVKNSNNEFSEIKDFGISFGVNLPSKRKFTNIDIAFDMGKRGEINNGLVKENYYNFRLSFSFVDKWFKKRKLN